MKDLIANMHKTRRVIGALVQVLAHDYLQRKLIFILKAEMFIFTLPPPPPYINVIVGPRKTSLARSSCHTKKTLHFDPLLHLIRGGGRVSGANAYLVRGTKLTEIELISGLGLAREALSHRPICLEAA
jgi:hypothetical protein